MAATLSRDKFYFMHMLRCKECLNEWVGVKDITPEERKNVTLERIVEANHDTTTIR